MRPSAVYGWTIAAVGIALLVRWLIDPWLGDHLPFITFFAAIAAAAWLGGLRSAVLATLLGLLLSWFIFVPPRMSFSVASTPHNVGLAMYVLVALAISAIGEAFHRTRRRLKRDLETTEQLHEISSGLFEGGSDLYQKLVSSAAAIMRSDFGSMQMLYPERGRGGELLLLAFQGFNPDSARFWQWVDADSQCVCGAALRTARRVIVSDVEQCDWMAGTEHLASYRRTGIRAVQSTPLVSRDGRIVGMISTHWSRPYDPPARDLRLFDILVRQAADLVERKRSEEALRESAQRLRDADRRKDEFLATLAHELRGPLAPVRNMVEVLRRAPEDRGIVIRAGETIDRQLRHIVRLVDDLLDVSRISEGKIQLRPAPVDLAALIHRAVENTRSSAECLRQDLQVDVPDTPIHMRGDALRLVQVFSNLLDNACKFTPAAGTIRIAADTDGTEAVVRVSDTGRGIPPDQLGSVFEKFVQLDHGTELPSAGLGLGLSLVKDLLAMHGGSVEARSEGVGKGSEFVVRLPLAVGVMTPSDLAESNQAW